jgi:hypothetical protein
MWEPYKPEPTRFRFPISATCFALSLAAAAIGLFSAMSMGAGFVIGLSSGAILMIGTLVLGAILHLRGDKAEDDVRWLVSILRMFGP